MADIAAHMDGVAGGLQQLGNDGGRGGLAVRSGHGDDGTGANLEEHLHLGGHLAAAFCRLFQLGHIRTQTGGTKDYILMQIFQIVISQPKCYSLPFQLLSKSTQCGAIPTVAGGHSDFLRGQ